MNKWTRINYQPNLPLEDGHYVTACDAHIALSREAAAEGMVLLKNEQGLLPLARDRRVCLLGKGTFDYVKGGGGSGDVNTKYVRNLYDGVTAYAQVFEPLANFYHSYVDEQYAQGGVPGMIAEPELPDALLAQARSFSDTAIISISRFSGEGWDRSDVDHVEPGNPPPKGETKPMIAGRIFPKGDFYLSEAEQTLVDRAACTFENVVVVLNVGGMVDTTWIKNDARIGAALISWQGGMEGALAAADILFGEVNPSGKLPDTFAACVEDYPSTARFHESYDYVDYTEDIYVGYRYFETLPGMKDRVCYPFGYGLSYTQFDISVVNAVKTEENIAVTLRVQNCGQYAGKEVVQIYFSAPQGKLGKPARALAAFEKTKLLSPNEAQTITLRFAYEDMASYDDLGYVQKSAYVLERGEYAFFVGTDVRSAARIDFTLTLNADEIVCQLSEKLAPSALKARLRADGSMELLPAATPNDPNACLFPKLIASAENDFAPAVRGLPRRHRAKGYVEGAEMLKAVADGKLTLDEFMAQLSDDELLSMLGGQPNLTVANTYGIGNLPEYGVPNAMTADGPAGVRIDKHCGVATTAFPCGTLLASTWNPEIVKQVGQAGGRELKENNLAMWLTPAINIHRSPLCGRNFEYYSEDPLLAGTTAAAMVKGIQSNKVSACVKHFAVNNKETNRKQSDSRVSQRALREIYLKAFEIIVKTADPWTIMSSYNIINGWRASECRDLLETILRDEWGYQGLVVTDWWTRGEHYKEILAGNDVKMGSGFPDRVAAAQEKGAIGRADYEHCARRVLEMIMKLD